MDDRDDLFLSESRADDGQRLLRPEDTTTASSSRSTPTLIRRNVYPVQTCRRASTGQYLPSFLLAHRTALYASGPILGAILWTSMKLYFFLYYLFLPRLHGAFPRIGYTYAAFPYISCIGAVRLPYFQAFCIAVALLNSTSFFLDLYLTSSIHTARHWRWCKAICSWIGSLFLVLLSYYSVNSNDQLHLDFTSGQIVFTGLGRCFDGLQQIALLRTSPGNPYIVRPNRVKKVAAVIAGPTSLLAVIGFWGCRKPLDIIARGTTCHTIVSISAPCEWIVSAAWVMYMVAIAMDLYYVDGVREDFRLLYRGKASSIELFPFEAKGKGDTKYRPLSTLDEDARRDWSAGKKSALAAAWFRHRKR